MGTCVSIVTFGVYAHLLIHHIHSKSGGGGGAFAPNFAVLVPGGFAHVTM